jgi:hypothetical protein
MVPVVIRHDQLPSALIDSVDFTDDLYVCGANAQTAVQKLGTINAFNRQQLFSTSWELCALKRKVVPHHRHQRQIGFNAQGAYA